MHTCTAIIHLEQDSYNVTEGDGLVQVCVEVTIPGNTDLECDITAVLTSSNGTAGNSCYVYDVSGVIMMMID